MNEMRIFFMQYTKINSKYTGDLNVRPEIIKLLEESIGRAHFGINNCNNFFLDLFPKAKETKANTHERDLITCKTFCTARKSINKTTTKTAIKQKKIFECDMAYKGLISELYKQLI